MSIRFGAATLFVQSQNAARQEKQAGDDLQFQVTLERQISNRFKPVIEQYIADNGLKPEDTHIVPMSKARCLVVDGPDFAEFAKEMVLTERKNQNPWDSDSAFPILLRGFLSRLYIASKLDRFISGTPYNVLLTQTAEKFVAQRGHDIRTIDLLS
jgi:hypothetical protein